jgi:hypothetical protein
MIPISLFSSQYSASEEAYEWMQEGQGGSSASNAQLEYFYYDRSTFTLKYITNMHQYIPLAANS